MKKILLVDVDEAYLGELGRVLEGKGYAVELAHSRVEGLKKALAWRPDVIVLEAILETDTAGFEFIYQLRAGRADSRYREIRNTPVIIVSAIHEVTHFRFSLNEEASYLPPISAMLTKPLQLEALLAELEKLGAATA